MEKVNKRSRWPVSLAIIAVVVVVSIALGITLRVQPGEIPISAVSDDSGGIIVAWKDGDKIYAQRIGPAGEPLWSNDGVLVCARPMLPGRFALIGDGLGGAIITWDDRANLSDDHESPAYWAPIPVYSQRIDADGEPLWGEGIPIGATLRRQLPQVISDGTGGAIIFWNDFQPVFRALHDDYLYLQKIGAEGSLLWGEKGILLYSSPPYRPVTPEEKEQGVPGTWTRSQMERSSYHVVSDSSGGSIVFWKEEVETRGAYAQRFDAGGQPVWQDGGIPIPVYTISGDAPKITLVVSDGYRGAIAILGTDGSHNAQRVSAEGKLLWPEGGVSLRHVGHQIAGDGLGGAVLLVHEGRHLYGTDPRITGQCILYVERLDSKGHLPWLEEPLLITEKGQLLQGVITGDGSGGAVIAWRTWEHTSNWKGKVSAQKLDAEGKPLWREKGIAVFTALELKYQGYPKVVSDGSGGAIVLAVVGEKPSRGDTVYAQRLDAKGNALWGDGVKISP